jgi:hypothetical protein
LNSKALGWQLLQLNRCQANCQPIIIRLETGLILETHGDVVQTLQHLF